MLLLAAVALGGCGDTYQVAARIDGESISFEELEATADRWAENPDFLLAVLGDVPVEAGQGRADQQLVLAIVGIRAQSVAAARALESSGQEVPADLTDGLRTELDTIGPEFSDAEKDEIVALFGPIIQLSQLGGFLPLPEDEVYVSPRLGRYDAATGSIAAPEGPVAPPSDFDFTGA